VFFRLSKHEKPPSFLSLDSLNKHWKALMGPNHSFLGFAKNTSRDLSKGWDYIKKHMLSSSSLCKNKAVLTINGGGNFGKGICILICTSGSKRRSWTWHPLFVIWIWVGKSICLSSDLLQGHILGRLWVNVSNTIFMSFICSREVQTILPLSQPSTVFNSYHVGLPCVHFKSYSYFDLP